MLSDFVPIVHKLDGRTIRVWAVADVHIGARECDLDGFKKFIKRISEDDDSYLVVCGDLLNNGLRSPNCPTDIYDETMPPHAQIETAVEILTPVKDKILGCVGGNHEHRSRKMADLSPLYAVMLMLGIGELYRDNFAFVRINLERGKTKDHYALLLVHGASNTKRNKFDLSAIEGVDAIIGGHVHCGDVGKNRRLVLTSSNSVKYKDLISITAVSWLNYGSYAARSLYLPKVTSDTQSLILEFTGTNKHQGRISVSW